MTDLIVCATDFSAEANSALSWAASVARRDGSPIDLVHVEPPHSEDARALAADSRSFELEKGRVAMEHLRVAAHKMAHELDVSVRPQLLRGEPHDEIVKYARENDARMIVMGSSGHPAVDRWAFGSVAERTMRLAGCPVVVVPRAPDGQRWFEANPDARSRAPRIVVGLGAGPDLAVLRFVARLRRKAPCDVTFLQLYSPMEEYARLGLQGTGDWVGPDPDIMKDLEPSLRAKIGPLPGVGQVDVDIRPAWGDLTANLLVAVEDHEAELIVVGAGQRHGLARFATGTIAERLARRSHYIPVVCVPSDETAPAKSVGTTRVHTVLAVTDLSAAGNAAVLHAYSLLSGTGGVVELCHVHEATQPHAYDLLNQRLTDLQRASLTRELRALIPPDANSLRISTHISIVDGGNVSEAIVQTAERLKVDVISMASRGRGILAQTFLSSVAQEVVHRSHRPVLVVRG